jgi:hypothetical protein
MGQIGKPPGYVTDLVLIALAPWPSLCPFSLKLIFLVASQS